MTTDSPSEARVQAIQAYATWCVDYQPEMRAPTVPGRAGNDGKPICVKCEKSKLAHEIRYLLDVLTASHAALDTLRQENERLHELIAPYASLVERAEAAEAECATLRAQLAVVSSESQTP